MPKSALPAAWEIPGEIRSRFGEKIGRQRAMFAAGHLLLVFHAPPRADENERSGRLFWRKPDGTWQATETSGGANTVGKHLEEYSKRLEALDRSVDAATLARDYFAVMSHLSPLVRSARNLHKTLQEARVGSGRCRADYFPRSRLRDRAMRNCSMRTRKTDSTSP